MTPESERCRHEWRSPHAVDGLRYVDRYFQPPQDAPVWCPSCGSVKVDTRIFSPVVHNERAGLEAVVAPAHLNVDLLYEWKVCYETQEAARLDYLEAKEQFTKALTAERALRMQVEDQHVKANDRATHYYTQLQTEREKATRWASVASDMAEWLAINHDDCDDECEVWPMIERVQQLDGTLVTPTTEATGSGVSTDDGASGVVSRES
jgi:hypothetical protein